VKQQVNEKKKQMKNVISNQVNQITRGQKKQLTF
jgi:hypothetical protein